jgi:hypothetical protein
MDAGQLALDDALERVEQSADEKWIKAADYAVSHLALRKPEITTDDVWDVLDGLDVETPEHRAMGAVMLRAAKAGFIERTDRTTKTRRPSRHKGDVRVWRSRIFWEDQ